MCTNHLRFLIAVVSIIMSTLFFVSFNVNAMTLKEQDAKSQALIKSTWADPTLEFQFLTSIPPLNSQQSTVKPIFSPKTSDLASDFWLVAYQEVNFVAESWDIYTSNAYNQLAARLTENSGNNVLPQLSHDAAKVVFVSDRDGNPEIYTTNVDGGNPQRLTSHPATDTHPAWSPDGKQIVFTSTRHGNPEIYVMNADGSGLLRLTIAQETDFYPSWSSDGTQIVWVKAVSDSTGNIMVIDQSGANVRTIAGPLLYTRHPLWSPDNKYIAFDYDADNDYFNDIAVMDITGENLRTALDGGTLPDAVVIDLWASAWTPDSKAIIQSGRNYAVIDPYKPTFAPSNYSVIKSLCIVSDCPNWVNLDGISKLGGNVRQRDTQPPTTLMKPLPEYTRGYTVRLEWEGKDAGMAGIQTYEAQYRTESDQEWKYFFIDSYSSEYINGYTSVPFSIEPATLVPGQSKVFFRIRARDAAENIESWRKSGNGYASTVFYLHRLDGVLTDARGVPLAEQLVNSLPQAIESITTDRNGEFIARFAASGEYLINNAVHQTIDSDSNLNLYRQAENDVIKNGDFESNLTHDNWWTEGNTKVVADLRNVNTGVHSLVLGQQCEGICISRVPTDGLTSQIIGGNDGYSSNLIILPHERQGIHVIGSGLSYWFYSFQNGWSESQQIATDSSNYFHAAIDMQNNIHVVWADTSQPPSVKYRMRNVHSEWTEQKTIGLGVNPKVAVNKSGKVAVVFGDCRDVDCSLGVAYKSKDAKAFTQQRFGNSNDRNQLVAVSDDGTIHILWQGMVDGSRVGPLYSTITGNKAGHQSLTALDSYASPTQLFIDKDQTLHASWYYGDTFYMQKAQNENWSNPQTLHAEFAARLQKDSNGLLHYLSGRKQKPDISFNPTTYQFKTHLDNWSPGISLAGSDQQDYFLAAVSDNVLYLTKADEGLYWTRPATETIESSITQSLTIPADMHQPTLSFMYQSIGGGNDSNFSVRISDRVTSTEVFSAINLNNWSLGWVDLSAWKGQPITVSFVSHQVAGEAQFLTFLDHVSLGSWQTPVPTATFPSHIDAGINTTVVISGENFIATPTVYLGGQKLSSVSIVSENSLQMIIPQTTLPGVYDIRVVNPGGQSNTLYSAIAIGKQTYLPLISR